MTIYELIQELTNYDANSEVRVVATASSDVEVETDEGIMDATFEKVGYFDIDDVNQERSHIGTPDVIISVRY